MSAQIQDNIAYLRAAERPVHALFVGPALKAANSLFQRKMEVVTCQHVDNQSDAVELIRDQCKEKPFDCVMLDMRSDDNGTPLNVVELAALGTIGHLVVLANAENAPVFQHMVGIDEILVSPVQPMDIIKSIVMSATPAPVEAAHVSEREPVVENEADEMDLASHSEELAEQSTASNWWEIEGLSERLKSHLGPASEAVSHLDNKIWQKFVPLASFAYKKLAIVLLSALFLTFLAYGAMIVFFMTNNNWSLPIKLSRGHVLVEKIERDLSSLNLRRNQLRQDLTKAMVDLSTAKREQHDGQLQLQLARTTIEQELDNVAVRHKEALNHVERLKKVVADFTQLSGKNGFGKDLDRAYKQRLITKAARNSGTLAVLETMHRLAVVKGELSTKRIDSKQLEHSLRFLNSLVNQMEQPEILDTPAANSDVAQLARELIRAKTQIATATIALESARLRTERLENSHEVISANIQSLEVTPAARAIKAPVTVLFVPYNNVSSVEEGDPLYSCVFSIFLCSQVGSVGESIDGESASVHPLFGKPMRGVFVEARFEDPQSASAEMVHAGSAPLWF